MPPSACPAILGGMDERDDYREGVPPPRPVRMVAVLLVAGVIVAWCVVAVALLANAVGK